MTIATYKNLILSDSGVIEHSRNHKIFDIYSPSYSWNSTSKINNITSKYIRLDHAGGEQVYPQKIDYPDLSIEDSKWTLGNSWLYDASNKYLVYTDGGTSNLTRTVGGVNSWYYRVTFTVSNWTGTDKHLYCKHGGDTKKDVTGDGTYTETWQYTGSNNPNVTLTFNTTSGLKCSVSDITLEHVDSEGNLIETLIASDMLFTVSNSWYYYNNDYWHLAGGYGTSSQAQYDFTPTSGKQYFVEIKGSFSSLDFYAAIGGQSIYGIYSQALSGGGWMYKTVTASNTNKFAIYYNYTSSAKIIINYISVRELDNDLSMDIDFSSYTFGSATNYPYFDSSSICKNVDEDIIALISNQYSSYTVSSSPDTTYYRERAVLIFDNEGSNSIDYYNENYTTHHHNYTSGGTNYQEDYDAGVNLATITDKFYDYDSVYLAFAGTKSDYDKSYYTSGSTTYYNEQWQKYVNYKIYNITSSGITSFEVESKVLDLSASYSITSGIYTSAEYLYSFSQSWGGFIGTNSTGDIFWVSNYTYVTKDKSDGSIVQSVNKYRIYKNSDLFLEYDSGDHTGSFFVCNSDTLYVVSGQTIKDLDGNTVYTDSDDILTIRQLPSGDFIVITYTVDADVEIKYFKRLDSSFNLGSSRYMYSHDLTAGSLHQVIYFSENSDFMLGGMNYLFSANYFKCFGGFRSVLNSFLFGGFSDPDASTGNPKHFLGFKQPIEPDI